MFKTFNYTYVFVMDCPGYDPYITTHTALCEDNARYLAWEEVCEEFELITTGTTCAINDFGNCHLVACFKTEPGAYFKSLI